MKEKPLIIIGNGGHSRVLVDILQLQKRDIIGFVAPDHEVNPYQIPYLGKDNNILEYSPKEIELINAIGSVTNTDLRKNLFEYFKSKNYSFSNVIHPSAVISGSVTLGEGVQILAGSVIQAFSEIADNTIINTFASVDHDCEIGKHCHIAPGTILSGGITVGEGTHIGTGATVIQNVHIGKKVLIGAGSLVLHDIADNKKVYGTPAKEVSR
ncbi:UDP-perosamine 4-acetyltransferase [Bacillus oleivorans]|uniref:UDP-perosamine 4-acetyltransferase n=1 Tax=Bacillus oleivorans TaxID=1448271 RepID=A0A285CZE1_9BACI|nr:acetyltransferase [Bacillus oleivorans]SNX72889.1 UDP-perosamine 4-acetyltransferase [Bacillus oleivorans]